MRWIVFSVACVAWSSVVGAEELLKWDDCLKEAAQNNPTIVESRHSLEKAGYLVDESRAAFLPSISASANVSRSATSKNGSAAMSQGGAGGGDLSAAPALMESTPFDAASPFNDDLSIKDSYSYGVTLKQSLFSGFRDASTVDKRKFDVDVAGADLAKSVAQVAFDLKNAFYQQLYAQALLDLNQKVALRRKDNVRIVELRYQGGRENKGAYLKSLAAKIQADTEVEQAKRGLELAQSQLARIMGRSKAADLRVQGEFPSGLASEKPNFRDLSRVTPSYKEAVAQSNSAAANLKAMRGQMYPDVSAAGSVSRIGDSWPPDSNRLSVGLTISLPLYTGGAQTAQIRGAEAEKARSEIAVTDVERQIAVDLQQSFTNVQDSIGRMKVQEEFLKASETRSNLARNSYSLGLVTFQEWDQIEDELITNQKAMLSSRKDVAVSVASWDKSLGKGFER